MAYTAAVLTISDKGFRGERTDTSGPALRALLQEAGWEVVHSALLPDEQEQIQAALIDCADRLRVNLVLTTGGTGFSPRDVTPEATLAVVEREARGIPEAMRAESLRITPRGCLSRSAAGIRGRTLIVNLPGSEKAARENLLAVRDAVGHGIDMLLSAGSADCAAPAGRPPGPLSGTGRRPPRCGGCASPMTGSGWRLPWPRPGRWRGSTASGRGSTRGSWRLGTTSCTSLSAVTYAPGWWRPCNFWWKSSRASASARRNSLRDIAGQKEAVKGRLSP